MKLPARCLTLSLVFLVVCYSKGQGKDSREDSELDLEGGKHSVLDSFHFYHNLSDLITVQSMYSRSKQSKIIKSVIFDLLLRLLRITYALFNFVFRQ